MELYLREMCPNGGSQRPEPFAVTPTETLEQLLERAGKPAHLFGVMRGGLEVPPGTVLQGAYQPRETIDVWPRPGNVSGGPPPANPYEQRTQPQQPTHPAQHPTQGAPGAPPAGANPYAQQAGAPAQAQQPGVVTSQPTLVTPQRAGGTMDQFMKSSRKEPARAAALGGAAQGGAFMPVSELSAYSGRNWRIKARVITKSDIRRFTNARGESQFFKVDLKDQSGEISGAFWGKACEKFFNILLPGQVFSFSKGFVKAANPRFDKGSFALSFEETSLVEPVVDDALVPQMEFAFKRLNDLDQIELNTLIDVQAVVYSPGEPLTFTARTSGREMTKRTIGLWDPSGPPGQGTTIELTLWGDKALTAFEIGSVLALKDARVAEWQNVKNISSPAAMDINPAKPEATALKAAFDERQRISPIQPVQKDYGGGGGGGGKRQSIQDAKTEDLQLSVPLGGGQFDPNTRSVYRHKLLGTITSVPSDRLPTYPSCPGMVESMRPGGAGQGERRACQKKVNDEGGVWRCVLGHECQAPAYRYICRMNLMDHSDFCELNLFDKEGRVLFGIDADEYTRAWNEEGCEQTNQRVMFKKVGVNVRSMKEVWNDTERVRINVESVSPVDYCKDGRDMLSEVHAALATASLAGA